MPPIIKIHLVAVARPNFMKVAPLYHQLKKENWCEPTIISTGQHYSKELSEVFYKEFSLPNPNFELKVGEGDSAEQLQKIIVAYEQVLSQTNPDLVIVVG
ncbi:MAG: UDP-N-acetylglucosamine 2-epimerase, partial [Deltaproteobacteria bacterium]|nr:UDP-N-acetylglucosamine 2-epimerase [Deltaproteobacteria bacterium]